MSKIDSALFNTHEHALENESCPNVAINWLFVTVKKALLSVVMDILNANILDRLCPKVPWKIRSLMIQLVLFVKKD